MVDYFDIIYLVIHMNFYRITFNSLPQILFAHRYSTNNYSLVLGKTQNNNRLEITFVEQGGIVFEKDNKDTRIYEEKTVNCNVYNERLRSIPNNKFHTHLTVGISGLSDIKIIKNTEILNYFDNDSNIVIVPETIPVDMSAKYKNIISNIIYSYTTKDNMKAMSELFSLFSALNEFSFRYERNKLGISYFDDLYCLKIKNYISQNIHKKIMLKDIANSLDMSEGYLCRIFKKNTGISIINYINKTKTDMAVDILLSKKITNSELARQLGIEDEKYFCRLFKQYTGKTVTEYKNMTV